MVVLWIVSQQYLLIVLPLLTTAVYLVYQTDGAHQPVRPSLPRCCSVFLFVFLEIGCVWLNKRGWHKET